MTVRKHFKQLVRDRMKKTGESYSTARRQLLKDNQPSPDPTTRWHFPGSVPATTALRVLLAAADVAPFSEEMLFGIAGGVGIGVAAFRYEKEDFSSFFLAGRHQWYDDLGYLTAALARFGIKPTIRECSGLKPAEKHLREALALGPCVAWVDMAHLPHRALPGEFSGGGYHVVVIYRIDDANQTAIIGDLTDEPITIPLADLAVARARIKKQANRLLSINAKPASLDLAKLVHGGLRASHQALTAKPGKGPLAMSTLDSLRKWGVRLAGSKDKESWEKMFPPGVNLLRALTWLHKCIETYGTGGGLSRPLMADFLREASAALSDARLTPIADAYDQLGQEWSALADAALPNDVPLLRECKEQQERYAELLTTNGSVEDKRQVWARLDELSAQAKAQFPLSGDDCADLRASLQKRVQKIIALEEAALMAVTRVLA